MYTKTLTPNRVDYSRIDRHLWIIKINSPEISVCDVEYRSEIDFGAWACITSLTPAVVDDLKSNS